MSWPGPLFGLLRRPAFPMILAMMAIPFAAISVIPVAPGKDLRSEIESGVAQVGMVAMVGALAGLAGMGWSLSRLDLWRSGLDWHLPGVRRWFLGEEILVATVVAFLAAAWIVTVHSEGPLAIRVIVGVSFSLAAFTAGGFDSDPSTPGMFRFAGFIGWYIPLFQAAEVERVLLAMPPVTVIACQGAAALLWRRRLDRGVARRRPHDGLASAATGTPEQWRKVKGPEGEWNTSLVSDQYRAWILAAVYEGGGGKASRPLGMLAFGAIATAITLQYIGSDFMTFTMIGMIIFASTVFPFRLASGLVYPLSRVRRGQLVAIGALLTEVAFVGLSAVLLILLKASPLGDVWHSPGPRETIPWQVVLMVAFAWMPIASWGSVRAAAGAWRVGRNVLTSALVPFLLYLAPVGLTLGPFGEWWRGGERMLVVELVVLISVVCRLVLWWATRRHFARADLSPVVSA